MKCPGLLGYQLLIDWLSSCSKKYRLDSYFVCPFRLLNFSGQCQLNLNSINCIWFCSELARYNSFTPSFFWRLCRWDFCCLNFMRTHFHRRFPEWYVIHHCLWIFQFSGLTETTWPLHAWKNNVLKCLLLSHWLVSKETTTWNELMTVIYLFSYLTVVFSLTIFINLKDKCWVLCQALFLIAGYNREDRQGSWLN